MYTKVSSVRNAQEAILYVIIFTPAFYVHTFTLSRSKVGQNGSFLLYSSHKENMESTSDQFVNSIVLHTHKSAFNQFFVIKVYKQLSAHLNQTSDNIITNKISQAYKSCRKVKWSLFDKMVPLMFHRKWHSLYWWLMPTIIDLNTYVCRVVPVSASSRLPLHGEESDCECWEKRAGKCGLMPQKPVGMGEYEDFHFP